MRQYLSKLISLSLIALSIGASASTRDERGNADCFRYERGICEIALSVALAHADRLDEETISVVGYLGRHKDELRLYLTEDAGLVGDVASSIRIRGIDQSVDDDLEKMAEAYIRIIGVLRRDRAREGDKTQVAVQRSVLLMRSSGRDVVREILESEQRRRTQTAD